MDQPLHDLSEIYTAEWRERVRHYFEHGRQFSAARDYWAFGFERAWEQHTNAVKNKLEFVNMLSHWIEIPGSRVLVVGSFLGEEAIAFALRGANVTAIDLDREAIDLSQDLISRFGVDIQCSVEDATKTRLPSESFDVVSCTQVLEHLPPVKQQALLGEMWRVCRTGGLIWLDTPNRANWIDRHDTGLPFIHWLPHPMSLWLARRVGRAVPTKEAGFGFRAVGVHHFLSFFQVTRFLKQLGSFEVLSRYRGFADLEHYRKVRTAQSRGDSPLFETKLLLMQAMMRLWNFNWFQNMRLVIRKKA
ncbi:MAG: class I SAM-dependent methyltransferase [Nitrospiraceae bacterium]